MQLILVRHGEANPIDGKEITQDSERTLTKRGEFQAQQTAGHIIGKYTPDVLVVSPFVRAKQTMRAFEGLLGKNAMVYQGITPADDDAAALNYLAELAESQKAECMLVVCHMGIIARLHERLLDDYAVPFALAEARVYEQVVLSAGLGKQIAGFVPSV